MKRERGEQAYSLVMIIAQLLAHELVHPLRILVVAAAVDARDYKRHGCRCCVVCGGCVEAGFGGCGKYFQCCVEQGDERRRYRCKFILQPTARSDGEMRRVTAETSSCTMTHCGVGPMIRSDDK